MNTRAYAGSKRISVIGLTALLFTPAWAGAQQPEAAWPLPAYEKTDNATGHDDGLPVLDETAGLSDYLRYAALNNPGLEAAFNRWKATMERVAQADALPDPRFNYTYFIEQVETRVGPQEQKFAISQVLPWFGKRGLKGTVAEKAADAQRQQYEKTKLRLFYRMKSAYYDYYYLARALAVTRDHIQLVQNLEAVARTRYKAGRAPYSAMVQAQVELGKLEDRLRAQEALRDPIVAKLNAAMNRPLQAELPWPNSIPEQDSAFTDEEAATWLVQFNPEVKRLESLSEKEETSIRLARRNYYPDVAIGMEYVDTGEALDPDMPDSGKDAVMAMASISLPLWFGKYRAAEREANQRHTAAILQREDTQNRLQADLELALYKFRDAARKIDLYRDTLVPKAKQSLNVTQQGFEAGEVSFVTLIDAQRLLLEFQLSFERAFTDYAVRLAEIEMLVGKNLSVNEDPHGPTTDNTGT